MEPYLGSADAKRKGWGRVKYLYERPYEYKASYPRRAAVEPDGGSSVCNYIRWGYDPVPPGR